MRLSTPCLAGLAVAVGLTVPVIVAFWLVQSSTPSVQGQAGMAPESLLFEWSDPPAALPDITFTDAAGQPRDLAEFRGRTVLLNLWATWCAPCIRELPALDNLEAAAGGDGFKVIVLSQDRGGLPAVETFWAERALEHLELLVEHQYTTACHAAGP